MRTVAVLPIKSFPNAKQRLRVALEPGDRCALATAMVQDVLAALAASRLDALVVVTGEPVAAEAARRSGAQVLADPAEAKAPVRSGASPPPPVVPSGCVSTDPDEVVDRIAPYVELGFEQLVFHGPGADQERFFELFGRDVLPRLRARFG